MRETSASESLATHRKRIQMTSKPGTLPSPGKSMAETYLLAMPGPVLRRRDSHSGCCTAPESLDGDGKGKGTSGQNREAESTDAPARFLANPFEQPPNDLQPTTHRRQHCRF